MLYRILACAAFLTLFVGAASVAVAADDKPASGKTIITTLDTPIIYGGVMIRGVFGFPAKECPPGSKNYLGPEQADMQKLGYSYCVLARHYSWFYKTANLAKCPDGKDPVSTTHMDNDGRWTNGEKTSQVIWCDLPDARFTNKGVMLPLFTDKASANSAAVTTKTPPPLPAPKIVTPPPPAPPPKIIVPTLPPSGGTDRPYIGVTPSAPASDGN